MADGSPKERREVVAPQREVIEALRQWLSDGREWAPSLLGAMALWTVPEEVYRGRTYTYLVRGEAFDWLLLAERLCQAVDGLIPLQDAEALLFHGKLPQSFDAAKFKGLLGVEKYRGLLNYHYGVTVEEALQLAAELEVQKRHMGNGVQYRSDYSDEGYIKIYRAPKSELLAKFRQEIGHGVRRSIGLGETKEFTYWLFKYRLKTSDKAKAASDTKKGLDMLRRMQEASEVHSVQ